MIPKTHTVVPFLIAMFAAVAGMPTNVYQVCRRSVGTLEVEPWLEKSSTAIVRAVTAVTSWMKLLLALRAPALCAAAVLLALLAADLSASHAVGGVLLAIPPIAVTTMTMDQLRAEREQLVRANDAFTSGNFPNDEARSTFDANTKRIADIDGRIKELEKTPAPAPTPTPVTADTIRAEERARISGINDAVRVAGLDSTFAAELIGRDITLDQARAAIFAKLAEKDKTSPTVSQVRMGEDARDKWVRGAMSWLLIRSGQHKAVAAYEKTDASKIDAGEFRGMSMIDLAKESLERAGVKTRGMDRMQIAGMAMAHRTNYQTTSDFSTLLENAMHKVLRAAYAITPDTWSRWCGTATVSDFRAHNWYRLGSLTALDDLNENGEFKNKNIQDAEKSTYQVGTKGNIIAITREVIVNDDLGAVMRLTQMLGRAGKLTIEKAAYSLLGENGGLGPTQSDAQPLFDANRSNVGAGAAISMAALDADATVMAVQTDPNGEDILDLRPAVLLVPRGLEGTARSINEAQYDPDTTGKLQKPNIVRGLFSDIVGTGRLSGTRRYMFADISSAPVFVVSFLEGQQEPVLETQDGWRVDGVEMKARLDFGVDVVDFRGAVTDAGV